MFDARCDSMTKLVGSESPSRCESVGVGARVVAQHRDRHVLGGESQQLR
jgi:hypothetical protein